MAKTTARTDQPIGVETKSWAMPAEGVTLDDLTLALSKLGVPILERDEEGNRLLVGYDLLGPPPPPLHTYEETCCVARCNAKANHLIEDGSHWCDLHLVGVRSLLEQERLAGQTQSDPHKLRKQWEG